MGGPHVRKAGVKVAVQCACSMAAAIAAETSFKAAQRLTESDLRAERKIIPGTMFQGVQLIQ